MKTMFIVFGVLSTVDAIMDRFVGGIAQLRGNIPLAELLTLQEIASILAMILFFGAAILLQSNEKKERQ